MGKSGKSNRQDDDSRDYESSSDDESDTEEVVPTTKRLYTNKQRILVVASRGITARYRHLLEDLKKLIPHHKKDNKLDSKGEAIRAVNEIAELKSCNQILYLETRKHQDLYMYLGKAPQGPSIKFQVVNIHTMDELKLTGNCMLGSRPLLNFDKKFETQPHWQLMKTIFNDAFGTPLGHPKSKPFVDRIMSFFIVNDNIWIRNYQIIDKSERAEGKDTHLVEIGPRFVLIPIRIFSGSLGGATLYQNQSYVTPNDQRAEIKRSKGNRYEARVEHRGLKRQYDDENRMPIDVLSNKRVFSR